MTTVVSPDGPPPTVPALAQLGLGEILAGKYRVEELIGSGGMGLVIAATHMELDRRVAIKMMNKEALGDPESRIRFAREAKATVRLKSQHVARVLDVGTLDDGAPFLVMEFLEGSDLQSVIFEHGQLLPHEAVAYMLQACEAVAEAHGLGIVHRDLKPRNLFVTTGVDGTPLIKVLDFGISKFIRPTGDTLDLGLTKTHDVIGSPSYMAPEQMRAAKHATERSDIWSLGVILFESITGQLPWQAESVSELTAMVFRDPPRKMREVRPDAPEGLEAIVEKCLEKEPENRYASVEELAHALEPFANGLSTGAAARIESVARTTKRPPGSKPSLADRPSAGSARVMASGGTSVSWGETEPMEPKRSVPPPASARSNRGMVLFGGAFVATFVLAVGGYMIATRGEPASAGAPPVLPEDRGANRPPTATTTAAVTPATATAPTASASSTAVASTAAASATTPMASIPRKAAPSRAETPAVTQPTAATAAAAPAPPPTGISPPAKADPHDMGSIGRK